MICVSPPSLRLRSLCFAMLLGSVAVWASPPSLPVPPASPPGLTPAGFSYPLDGITSETDLLARVLSGGCWLAGLPGRPRYNGVNVHAGIDLRANLGDTIYAIAPGVVEPASDTIHSGYGPGWTPGYMMLVRCALPDGTPYLVIYGHTQAHKVKGGDAVVAGRPLAEVGPWLADEGGPHLHLTIRLGELPRYGWGTPTLAGQPLHEGAEAVACDTDVEALGYRNPVDFLKGIVAPRQDAPKPNNPDGPRDFPAPLTPAAAPTPEPLADREGFLARAAQYWRDRNLPAPQPMADPFSRSADPVKLKGGWLQTYGKEGKPTGALLQKGDDKRVVWVGEPLWTIYNLQGGPSVLGYPVEEAFDWTESYAQSFQRALLVMEKQTGRVHVIERER